jgi:hypothetical protein
MMGSPSRTAEVSLIMGGYKRKDVTIFQSAAVGTSTTIQLQKIQQILHHWQVATLCNYHGNNNPWLPILAVQIHTGLCGFRGLVVD